MNDAQATPDDYFGFIEVAERILQGTVPDELKLETLRCFIEAARRLRNRWEAALAIREADNGGAACASWTR